MKEQTTKAPTGTLLQSKKTGSTGPCVTVTTLPIPSLSTPPPPHHHHHYRVFMLQQVTVRA